MGWVPGKFISDQDGILLIQYGNLMEVSRSHISAEEIKDVVIDDRFLKLPIENYLGLINIVPNPPQVALINCVNDPQYRFITAVLARRTGKSFIANVIAQLVLLIPETQVLIMAPNYSLSKVSWDIQKKLIKQFDIELERCNEKDIMGRRGCYYIFFWFLRNGQLSFKTSTSPIRR